MASVPGALSGGGPSVSTNRPSTRACDRIRGRPYVRSVGMVKITASRSPVDSAVGALNTSRSPTTKPSGETNGSSGIEPARQPLARECDGDDEQRERNHADDEQDLRFGGAGRAQDVRG